MSGHIWFGFDKSDPENWKMNDGYVDTPTFMVFSDVLTQSLKERCLRSLEDIKRDEAMAIYRLCRLLAEGYNSVIRAIRARARQSIKQSDWQRKGLWVWIEMAEPFIRSDERYDFKFHEQTRPAGEQPI